MLVLERWLAFVAAYAVLLAIPATLFTALKWVGAVYLGIKLWRALVSKGAIDGVAHLRSDLPRGDDLECGALRCPSLDGTRDKPGIKRAVNRWVVRS